MAEVAQSLKLLSQGEMMKKMMMTFFLTAFALSISAQEGRNVAEYNLNSNGTGFVNGNQSDALGFDPVSVFPEGGGIELAGKQEFALTYEGVEYLFANSKNMKTFLSNPQKYEPTYGGWCARAMVVGQKVHINTGLFTVVGNRSYFFVNSRAKRYFDRNIERNAQKADENWKRISGESPRL